MSPKTTLWSPWREHFTANAARPLPPIAAGDPALVAPEDVGAALRPHLARTLARFQIGEGGEGRVAREVWKVRDETIDDDYRVALGLFVREEGRHARILAGMVRALGGDLVRTTWTERLFVRGRRLAGLRLKVLCLLAAEVVGIGFYGAVASRCRGPLADALRQITGDEEAHLRFHVDFFRAGARTPVARLAFAAAWVAIAGVACGLVLLDHRRTLRALGVPLADAARDYTARIAAVLADVRRAAPAPRQPDRPGAAPLPRTPAARAA